MPTYTVTTPRGGTRTVSYSAFSGSKGSVASSGGKVEAYGIGLGSPAVTAKDIEETGGKVATTPEGIKEQAESIAAAQTKLEKQKQAGEAPRQASVLDIISPRGGAYSGRYRVGKKQVGEDSARAAIGMLRGSGSLEEGYERIMSSSPQAYGVETSQMTSDAGVGPPRGKQRESPTFLYDTYLNKQAEKQMSQYVPAKPVAWNYKVTDWLGKEQSMLGSEWLRAEKGGKVALAAGGLFGLSVIKGPTDVILHPWESIKGMMHPIEGITGAYTAFKESPITVGGEVTGQMLFFKKVGEYTGGKIAKIGSSSEAELSGLKNIDVRTIKQAGGKIETASSAYLEGAVRVKGFLGKVKIEKLVGFAKEKSAPAGNLLMAQKGVLKLIGEQSIKIGKKFKAETITEGISKPISATQTATTRFLSTLTKQEGKIAGAAQVRMENLITRLRGKVSTSVGASKKLMSAAKADKVPSLSLKDFERLYPQAKIDQLIYGKSRLFRRATLVESPEFTISRELSKGASFSAKLDKYTRSRQFSAAAKAKRYNLATETVTKTRGARQVTKLKFQQKQPISSLQSSLKASTQQIANDLAKASQQALESRGQTIGRTGGLSVAEVSKAFPGRVPEFTKQQTYPYIAPPTFEKAVLPPQAEQIMQSSFKMSAPAAQRAVQPLKELTSSRVQLSVKGGSRQVSSSAERQLAREIQKATQASALEQVSRQRPVLSLRTYQGQVPRQSVEQRVLLSLRTKALPKVRYGSGAVPKVTAPPPPPPVAFVPPPVITESKFGKKGKYRQRVGFGEVYVPSVEAILRNIKGSASSAGLKGIGLRPIPTGR